MASSSKSSNRNLPSTSSSSSSSDYVSAPGPSSASASSSSSSSSTLELGEFIDPKRKIRYTEEIRDFIWLYADLEYKNSQVEVMIDENKKKMRKLIKESKQHTEEYKKLVEELDEELQPLQIKIQEKLVEMLCYQWPSDERPDDKTHIKVLAEWGDRIPVWFQKSARNLNEKPPILCGAIPAPEDYQVKTKQRVAAFTHYKKKKIVKGKETFEVRKEWILAEVKHVLEGGQKIEVYDLFDKTKKHVIIKENIVPTPLYKADPEDNPEAIHQVRTKVLALHPSSTVFYPGLVHTTPATLNDKYKIVFADSKSRTGLTRPHDIAQGNVVPYTEPIEDEDPPMEKDWPSDDE